MTWVLQVASSATSSSGLRLSAKVLRSSDVALICPACRTSLVCQIATWRTPSGHRAPPTRRGLGADLRMVPAVRGPRGAPLPAFDRAPSSRAVDAYVADNLRKIA